MLGGDRSCQDILPTGYEVDFPFFPTTEAYGFHSPFFNIHFVSWTTCTRYPDALDRSSRLRARRIDWTSEAVDVVHPYEGKRSSLTEDVKESQIHEIHAQ